MQNMCLPSTSQHRQLLLQHTKKNANEFKYLQNYTSNLIYSTYILYSCSQKIIPPADKIENTITKNFNYGLVLTEKISVFFDDLFLFL